MFVYIVVADWNRQPNTTWPKQKNPVILREISKRQTIKKKSSKSSQGKCIIKKPSIPSLKKHIRTLILIYVFTLLYTYKNILCFHIFRTQTLKHLKGILSCCEHILYIKEKCSQNMNIKLKILIKFSCNWKWAENLKNILLYCTPILAMTPN